MRFTHLIIPILFLFSCQRQLKDTSAVVEVFYSMEDNKIWENLGEETSGQIVAEKAYEGNKSLRLSNEKITLPIKGLISGDILEVSFWVLEDKSLSKLIVSSKGCFYKHTIKRMEHKSGWFKKKINFVIPEKVNNPTFQIKSSDQEVIYVDNISVKVIKKRVPERKKHISHLELLIDAAAQEELVKKRNSAIKSKVLIKIGRAHV